MTEAEWLACDDPTAMMGYLVCGKSDRRLRLFGVACCRRIRGLMSIQSVREAVEVAERVADDAASEVECDSVRSGYLGDVHEGDPDRFQAAGAACELVGDFWGNVNLWCGWTDIARAAVEPLAETREQSPLVRDIFGNPFRPVAFSPEWRTSTAIMMAQGMYESRDFGAMPILADALQDAGCDNDDVLTHCRGTGPHVRGCWVVDLVLGKE